MLFLEISGDIGKGYSLAVSKNVEPTNDDVYREK